MQPIVLIGAGGHARSVIDVIEATGTWKIAGFIDPGLPVGSTMSGYPILGGEEVLEELVRNVAAAHITIGQINTAAPRRRVFERLKTLGFEVPAIVSPCAIVSGRSTIAEGVTVMHHAAVGPFAHVGTNTIINSRALIEHDCRVGAHCHISTAAVLNGSVEVGNETFIGSGALIRQNVRIGERVIVGMGARVLNEIGDDCTHIGTGPARTST